jgi:hypothetical protein
LSSGHNIKRSLESILNVPSHKETPSKSSKTSS